MAGNAAAGGLHVQRTGWTQTFSPCLPKQYHPSESVRFGGGLDFFAKKCSLPPTQTAEILRASSGGGLHKVQRSICMHVQMMLQHQRRSLPPSRCADALSGCKRSCRWSACAKNGMDSNLLPLFAKAVSPFRIGEIWGWP